MTRIRLTLMLNSFMVVHKSYMQNPVEGLLEVYKSMVKLLLVLEIFLTEDS